MMNDQERLAAINKAIEGLEQRQLISELFIYLLERGVAARTIDGIVDPDELDVLVKTFVADRGDS